MTPINNYDADLAFIITSEPSYTHKLEYSDNTHVIGFVDGLAAVRQAIYKILDTERYRYVIYSWNYGIELQDLIGKSKAYVYSEAKRRITEALLQDDRIQEVSDFSFTDAGKKGVLAKFTVYTIYGEVESSKVVNY